MLQVLPNHLFPFATGLCPHRSQALLGSVCSGKLCFPSDTLFTEYPILGSGKQSFPARDPQSELGNHAGLRGESRHGFLAETTIMAEVLKAARLKAGVLTLRMENKRSGRGCKPRPAQLAFRASSLRP
jgi:hypothetical protein